MPVSTSTLGAGVGAVLGAGLGYYGASWCAPKASVAASASASASVAAYNSTASALGPASAPRRASAPFLPADAPLQGDVLELFAALAPVRDADPSAYDKLARAISHLDALIALERIEAVHVVKANRITSEAREAKGSLKRAILHAKPTDRKETQLRVFTDLESRLQTCIGEKLSGLMNRRTTHPLTARH